MKISYWMQQGMESSYIRFIYIYIYPLAMYQSYRDETSTLGGKVECRVIQHLIVKITHAVP